MKKTEKKAKATKAPKKPRGGAPEGAGPVANPSPAKERAAGTRSAPRETKVGRLRASLAEGPKTAAQLLEATGYDLRNLRTAIQILGNPKRTKEPVEIERVGKDTYRLKKGGA